MAIDRKIREAVALGRKLQQVFVSTADREGLPHMAAAGDIDFLSARRVAVAAWFCPATIENLQDNRKVSLVIWDPLADKGYQLLGSVEHIEDSAMLNGYSPFLAHASPLPQAQKKLLIGIDRVLAFSQAPHRDTAE